MLYFMGLGAAKEEGAKRTPGRMSVIPIEAFVRGTKPVLVELSVVVVSLLLKLVDDPFVFAVVLETEPVTVTGVGDD